MALATSQDVGDRLGRPLSTDETARVSGLLDEASVLVEGWIRCVPDPVPDAVKIVTSRIVARALTAATSLPGLSDQEMRAGSFGLTQRFSAESSSGGVWLTRQDKIALRSYGNGGKAMNFPTS